MSTFENVAKSAIEEIIRPRLHESRRGFVLTREGLETVVEELYQFLQMSRRMKEAGDRVMGAVASPSGGSTGGKPGRGARRLP